MSLPCPLRRYIQKSLLFTPLVVSHSLARARGRLVEIPTPTRVERFFGKGIERFFGKGIELFCCKGIELFFGMHDK